MAIDDQSIRRLEEIAQAIRATKEQIARLEQHIAGLEREGVKLLNGTKSGRGRWRGQAGRSKQVLALVEEGLSRKEMRERLGVPHYVVNAALKRLKDKGLIANMPEVTPWERNGTEGDGTL